MSTWRALRALMAARRVGKQVRRVEEISHRLHAEGLRGDEVERHPDFVQALADAHQALDATDVQLDFLEVRHVSDVSEITDREQER
jgi:hypothetical protein